MVAFCLKTVVVIMLTMMVVVTDTDIGCDLFGYNNAMVVMVLATEVVILVLKVPLMVEVMR